MRFLADESCDFRVVRALRAAGHDVVAVPEVATGTEDSAVIEMAVHEPRIFVWQSTERSSPNVSLFCSRGEFGSELFRKHDRIDRVVTLAPHRRDAV
jgi:hypothetical protein